MSKLGKFTITLAAMTICGLASAGDYTPAYHLGVEGRVGLVGIQVCAKGDHEAGTRYIYTEDLQLRTELVKSAGNCFERLGREGDDGYATNSVTLIPVGGNVYKATVNGMPAGPAIRALAAPRLL